MVVSEQHLYQTIVLPRKLATGHIHDYLFCYCPLVGILSEEHVIGNGRFVFNMFIMNKSIHGYVYYVG